MSAEELPGWLATAFSSLSKQRSSGTLPHALLVNGPEGIGKQIFTRLFVNAVCCENPKENGFACNVCRSCRLIQAQTHPDIKNISPATAKKVITVDQIRDLSRHMLLKAQMSGNKVAVISPAEQMNISAANSLLKTLEEPPEYSLLILVSSRPSMLPATVRSRCQNIALHRPAREVAASWLKKQTDSSDDECKLYLSLSGGAPFSAKKLAERDFIEERLAMFNDLEKLLHGRADPVAVAETWLKMDIAAILYWLRLWAEDLLRLKSSKQAPAIANSDLRDRLLRLSSSWELKPLFDFYDDICNSARLCETSCNPQMLLENLLITWFATNRKNTF